MVVVILPACERVCVAAVWCYRVTGGSLETYCFGFLWACQRKGLFSEAEFLSAQVREGRRGGGMSKGCLFSTSQRGPGNQLTPLLTLSMLRLLSSTAQGCKDCWKPSAPCHVGTHHGTHMPGF